MENVPHTIRANQMANIVGNKRRLVGIGVAACVGAGEWRAIALTQARDFLQTFMRLLSRSCLQY